MSKPVYPNAFIIGVQKAGTTTLDDWLSQHPQVYCYDSLKDVHLFGVQETKEIERRLLQEPIAYNGQPVILQSAVNYIFYPHLLKALKEASPNAKLILLIRNPVDRAVSAYAYFQKMLREKRPAEEALVYEPKDVSAFTKENNDFTYIEHGFYHKQIKACLDYFDKSRLLVLDYTELKQPEALTKKIFAYLGVDENFIPDFTPKNITGEVKNQWLQEKLIKQGKLKKLIVKYIVDPIMPRSKRRLMKQKMFEMNTGNKNTTVQQKAELPEALKMIKPQLVKYFLEDAQQLDTLLGTNYADKWFSATKTV